MQTSAAEREGSALEPVGLKPASLKQRYVAWSLDAACLLPLLLLLGASHLQHDMANASAALASLRHALPRMMESMQANPQPTAQMAQAWLADPVLAGGVTGLETALSDLLLTIMLLYALLALLWSVGFESSRWQATPGKRALGLRVVAADGKKLTSGHALQRFLAASLSWLSLNIGHLMAALPPRHLALHDRISQTRVLREPQDARLPAWAWWWLILQGAAALAGFLWLFLGLQVAMNAAMQQVLGGL
ncbi:MAG: RDD family protein [Thermomonas sp.]